MKLKPTFVTQMVGDEQMMVSINRGVFSGLVRSNSTAAFIVDCLKEETTKENIVAKILNRYDVDHERAARDVDRILDQLMSIDAIDRKDGGMK